MRILRAADLGTCFGVRDAIALAHADAGPLTILGDLVHNPTVLSALEAPDSILVDRSFSGRCRAAPSS